MGSGEMKKLKQKLGERPLSLPFGLLAVGLIAAGFITGVNGVIYAGYAFVWATILVGMFFDL
jgi:hypothetical protein